MAFLVGNIAYTKASSTNVLAALTDSDTAYDAATHGEAGVGHDTSDFDTYYKITLTSYSGYTWVMYTSAGTGVDQVISSPATIGTGSGWGGTATYNGSDIYNVVLIAVPTWDNSVTYTLTANHHVYYDGLVYKSLQNANVNKNPATETTWWAVVADDDIHSKYRSEVNYAFIIPLEEAYTDFNIDVLAGGIAMYRKELLASIDFQKASKLWIMLETVDNLTGRSLWTNASTIIAYANNLIS